jgi:hypothetical protein
MYESEPLFAFRHVTEGPATTSAGLGLLMAAGANGWPTDAAGWVMLAIQVVAAVAAVFAKR